MAYHRYRNVSNGRAPFFTTLFSLFFYFFYYYFFLSTKRGRRRDPALFANFGVSRIFTDSERAAEGGEAAKAVRTFASRAGVDFINFSNKSEYLLINPLASGGSRASDGTPVGVPGSGNVYRIRVYTQLYESRAPAAVREKFKKVHRRRGL